MERKLQEQFESESRRTDLEDELQRKKAGETTMFSCPKCDSKKIDVQLVPYGTEEDSTKNFLTCLECFNKWMQD